MAIETILVVDDSATDRFFLTELLKPRATLWLVRKVERSA
jgi:CheY-like chemotaxis protein